MAFVHLRSRSHYSFLQALNKPLALIEKAKWLGFNALALTDEGNLYGWFEFYKYAKKNDINGIIGVEVRVAPKGRTNLDRDNESHSLLLLARDYVGFQNLLQIVTESHLTGSSMGVARVDFELLQQYSLGITALSGNYHGELARMITAGRSDEQIVAKIHEYKSIFWEHFYLEIQEHSDRAIQSKINETLVKIARANGFPLVATSDVHYASREDAEACDLLSCIGSGRAFDDPDRTSLIDGDYSLRSEAEMRELFAYAPDALENTVKIAESIHLDLPYGKTLIPGFELAVDEKEKYEHFLRENSEENLHLDAEEWLLRERCFAGLNTRFDFGVTQSQIDALTRKKRVEKPAKKLSEMSLDELLERSKSTRSSESSGVFATLNDAQIAIIERLEYELTVVDLMGFNGYFCIVSDFIVFSKREGIPVGPGRGSAAGALLAYLSGITDIDPLKYGLLFERFLNPSRVSMPDIDVDFSDEERSRVLEYVRNKYGAERVAQVATFGTMAARAAVKDVGKALGIPFAEMNTFAGLIPSKPGTKIKDALENSVEFKKAYDENPRYKKIVDLALKLEGCNRQLGVHACAVIIAPEAVTHFTALQHPPKDHNSTVTQLSQYPLEELGLLKMDFLGLRNLAILDRALKIIESIHNKKIDLLKIDFEDKKVFKIFAEGATTGVFQFESQGMRKYLRDLKPTSFEDIIAMVSLYRPGPLAYIPTYIARKHGKEKVSFPHPSLEAILKPTQGIAVYQEQIMQLVQAFAGFSLGEADILRRAIGKKKHDLLMEQRQKMIDAAKWQGHPEKLAVYIFDEIIKPFADYGFNKSHAACYAMIAYQTAFLKAYYPTEFMTALMTSDEEDTERVAMEIDECKTKDIQILPPDISQSRKHFTYISEGMIRFGLAAIKWVGSGPIEAIMRAREEAGNFVSVADFLKRCGEVVANKKTLESLILAGAMDALGERASLLASVGKMNAYAREHVEKSESSQMGLFAMMEPSAGQSDLDFELEKIEPMSFEERIRGEKLAIGYSVSGHPLDGLEPYIKRRTQGWEVVDQYREMLDSGEDEIEIIAMPTMTMSSEWDEVSGSTSSALESSITAGDTHPITEPIASINERTPVNTEDFTEKKDRPKETKVRFVGIVGEIRKTQTKSRDLMLIVSVESFGFKFTATVFPKSYAALAPKFIEGRVVVVEGPARLRPQMRELSVTVMSVETYTLSFIRKDAMTRWLFDGVVEVGEQAVELPSTNSQQSVLLDAPISPVVLDPSRQSELSITVPVGTTKDDLVAFKAFLQTLQTGTSHLWLVIWDRTIDTKFSLAAPELAQNWWKARAQK